MAFQLQVDAQVDLWEDHRCMPKWQDMEALTTT
jgi:hypothetical protein